LKRMPSREPQVARDWEERLEKQDRPQKPIEREFKWDALSSLTLRRAFTPLALISRLGEADRIDHERGQPHDFVGTRTAATGG
jgi:hypothetical protein